MTDPKPNTPRRLLAEFPLPEAAAWRAEAERLLKGVPFAKALVTRTLEGIDLVPLATAADTADLPWLPALPGQAPYQRGATAAVHLARPWLVAQELPLPTPAEFNTALRHDLQRGQTAVHLRLDAAGRRGLDPDRAPVGTVGAQGTSLADLVDLEAALAGVDLAAMPLMILTGSAALPTVALVAALARGRGLKTSDLRGLIGDDPLAELARDGALPRSLGRLRAEQAALVRWASAQAPGLRTLPVREDPWHDGGADGALSLGVVLAGAVATLRGLETHGVAPGLGAAGIQFHLSIGSDFFLEIARIRALRLLWSRVQEAAQLKPLPALIHAGTSGRTQTVHDAHVNLLRATTQALSAVLGGVQSLHVAPFDGADSLPDEFSRRLARNVQLLLLHECRGDRVIDPAGGSWYVEKLTADLAAAAWAHFQAIEAEGGLAASLATGRVQERIAAAAAMRRERLAVRKDVLVGTNRYADPDEPVRPPRRPDAGALARLRSAEVSARRRGEDEAGALAGNLTPLLQAASPELVPILAAAAAAGATLGELAGLLQAGDTADQPVVAVPVRRDAAPFEDLRRRVLAVRAGAPKRGRVACACVGDLARTLPRLDFTRGFFQVGGFAVDPGDFHATAPEAARAALATGAATVVVVALDDRLAACGGDLVRALKAGASPPQVILAGQPAGLLDDLRAAGVDQFIHARSDVLDVLGRLIDNLEVTR